MPIFNATRENSIITSRSKKLINPEYADYYINFQRDVMKISRKYQEKLLEGMRIAYSGVEGAFAHIAAGKIFSSGKRIAYSNFKEAYQGTYYNHFDLK